MEIRNSHLVKRGKTYYFRIRVPAELVKLVKITEIKHSTGTEDLAQALSVAKLWARKMMEIFDQVEAGNVNEKQIKKMLDDYFSAEFRRIRDIHLQKTYADYMEKQEEIEELESCKSELADDFHENRLLSVSTYVDSVYAFSRQPIPDKTNSEYLLICNKAFDYVFRLINAQIGMVNGKYDEPSWEGDKDEIILEPAQVSVAKIADGKTVKFLYDEYRAEKVRTNAWDGKTFRSRDGIFKLFFEVFGEDRNIRSFNHADMKKFRDDVLAKMPSNYGKHEKFKGKSYSEIIASPGSKPLSIATINDDLNIVISFFNWCIKHDYADKNPASGLCLDDNRRDDEKRSAYTHEDLQRILKSLPYTNDIQTTSPSKHGYQ